VHYHALSSLPMLFVLRRLCSQRLSADRHPVQSDAAGKVYALPHTISWKRCKHEVCLSPFAGHAIYICERLACHSPTLKLCMLVEMTPCVAAPVCSICCLCAPNLRCQQCLTLDVCWMSFGGCAVTVESQIGIVCFNSAAGEVCALTAHIPLEFKALQTRGWFICHYKKPGRCVPLQQCHDASTITVIRVQQLRLNQDLFAC
jgi:hypothetical protein